MNAISDFLIPADIFTDYNPGRAGWGEVVLILFVVGLGVYVWREKRGE